MALPSAAKILINSFWFVVCVVFAPCLMSFGRGQVRTHRSTVWSLHRIMTTRTCWRPTSMTSMTTTTASTGTVRYRIHCEWPVPPSELSVYWLESTLRKSRKVFVDCQVAESDSHRDVVPRRIGGHVVLITGGGVELFVYWLASWATCWYCCPSGVTDLYVALSTCSWHPWPRAIFSRRSPSGLCTSRRTSSDTGRPARDVDGHWTLGPWRRRTLDVRPVTSSDTGRPARDVAGHWTLVPWRRRTLDTRPVTLPDIAGRSARAPVLTRCSSAIW